MLLPEGFELSGAPKPVRWRRREVAVFASRILTSAVASDRGGFTPVRREEQRAALGVHTAKPITGWLESDGTLECDHEAHVGRKAFWWRLGERWRSAPLRHVWVDDPASLRAWDAIRGIEPGEPGADTDPVRVHLRRWLAELTLDAVVAAAGLATLDDDNDPAGLRRRYARLIVAIFDGEPADKLGDYDETAGRYHSAVTRMPRWLRPALRIHGQPLYGVDCKALQPLIQGVFAAREIVGGTQILDSSALPPDLATFFEVYRTGDIYRWLAPLLGMPCDTDEERDEVKTAWAHLVYCNPRKARFVEGWTERWALYKDRQPTIAGWLERVKRHDHAEAAIRCQTFEARVMIQQAARDLMANHPSLPIVTIHDAIYTTAEGVEIVESAIRRAWIAEGVEPRVKIDQPGRVREAA